jgi:hypothetical protein
MVQPKWLWTAGESHPGGLLVLAATTTKISAAVSGLKIEGKYHRGGVPMHTESIHWPPPQSSLQGELERRDD